MPDHVRRVDVLDVADLALVVILLLDDFLHELADGRQTLVPEQKQYTHNHDKKMDGYEYG